MHSIKSYIFPFFFRYFDAVALGASKQGVEIVVFYFHEMNLFDKDFVTKSYKQYLGSSKSKRIKKVYCVSLEIIYIKYKNSR
jgi:hypothetical protein